MTSKWEYLISISEEHGDNQYIGEYIKIDDERIPEIAELYGITELDVINSGRETDADWINGIFVLARSDYKE